MKLPRRRRLEAKTDYKARLALLNSEKLRLVVRKSNKFITIQLVESSIAQDKVILGTNSKILLEKGWPKELAGSLKSLPAAYLTGVLLGKMAKEKGISDAILDIGMYRAVKKSRLFAAVKGAIDAGLKVPCSKEALPEMEIIKNEKVKPFFDKVLGGLTK